MPWWKISRGSRQDDGSKGAASHPAQLTSTSRLYPIPGPLGRGAGVLPPRILTPHAVLTWDFSHKPHPVTHQIITNDKMITIGKIHGWSAISEKDSRYRFQCRDDGNWRNHHVRKSLCRRYPNDVRHCGHHPLGITGGTHPMKRLAAKAVLILGMGLFVAGRWSPRSGSIIQTVGMIVIVLGTGLAVLSVYGFPGLHRREP